MKKTITIVVLFLMTCVASAIDLSSKPTSDEDWTVFLDKLSSIESNGNTNVVVKDVNGKYSYGCLQIQQDYLTDSGLDYTVDDLLTKEASYAVAKAYLARYAAVYRKRTGKDATFEVLARIHNGGPTGWMYSRTDAYIDKLRAVL